MLFTVEESHIRDLFQKVRKNSVLIVYFQNIFLVVLFRFYCINLLLQLLNHHLRLQLRMK